MYCIAAPAAITAPPDITKFVTQAPKPDYPIDARARHASGTGIFVLRVEIKSGRVEQVIIGRAIGDKSLDAAAVKALARWHFKPGVLPKGHITSPWLHPPLSEGEALIKVPLTFALKWPAASVSN
jgi:TonB family protein